MNIQDYIIKAPELKEAIKGAHCGCTDPPFDLSDETFEGYEHDGGVVVQGYAKKQWVYITCPKCQYQWAYWKLVKHAQRFKELGF